MNPSSKVVRQYSVPTDVRCYRYDDLYQLVDVWYGANDTNPANITTSDLYQTYDLDTLGNRLVVENDGAGQSYGPQAGGQLTNPMNCYETVDVDTLSYDTRGNTLDDGINSYAYDVLNRQTVVTNTADITTEYIYDARGRRVAKVTARGVLGSAGVTVTHYLYDIQYRVLEERDGSGQLLALYTYGAGIDEPLTMERNGQTYYYHRDALGSVTELSDAIGAIVERYEYDVYGAVTIYDHDWITQTVSAAGNPYLFTGRRFDPESGNYYYRARVYSPALGRFLSMDPLGFEAGDYNLYRYVGNNPINLSDPMGHQEEQTEGFWELWQRYVVGYPGQRSAPAVEGALMGWTADMFLEVASGLTKIEGHAVLAGILKGATPFAGAFVDALFQYLDDQSLCSDLRLKRAAVAAVEGFVFGVVMLSLGPIGIPASIITGVLYNALMDYLNERVIFPALGLSSNNYKAPIYGSD